jgi:hypothetical protein
MPNVSKVPPQIKMHLLPGHRKRAGCPKKPDFRDFEEMSDISPEKDISI